MLLGDEMRLLGLVPMKLYRSMCSHAVPLYLPLYQAASTKLKRLSHRKIMPRKCLPDDLLVFGTLGAMRARSVPSSNQRISTK
jgi:hypothetical protein